MKLLFLIKALGLPGGGAERVLADVTGGLVERGHAVTIASFDPPGTASFYPFDPAIERINLGVGNVRRRTGLFTMLARLRAIRAVVDRVEPAVALGFMHSAYLPLQLALLGKPNLAVIGSEHTVYRHFQKHLLQRLMVRLLAPRLRAMTAVSDPMRESFPVSIRRRMIVIPNGVAAIVSGARSERGDKHGGVILAVGRLEPEKDHAILIAAFARISDQYPDWRLRIVGDGALRPALHEQIAALGLEHSVDLAGSVSDIASEYRAADLFALPSHYESFGLATAEALAHGMPAIGFADCLGTNELIVDGVNGLLVDGRNRVDALADALSRLIGSPKLRADMGHAAPTTVEAYKTDTIVSQWEEMLREVVADPTGKGRSR